MNGTNILSARNDVPLAQNDVSITTRQLAEQLKTSPKVILENAKKCLPNKKIENGKPTYWRKEEVTVLVEQLKTSNPNQHTFTGAVKAVSTDLTPALKLKKALDLAQEAYEEELAILRAKNIEMQPKAVVYDSLVDRSKTLNFRDMAAKLGMTQNEFMSILKAKYIYKNSVGEYRAYSYYSNLFALRTFARGVDKTGEQLLLSMDGINYFANHYGAKAENA